MLEAQRVAAIGKVARQTLGSDRLAGGVAVLAYLIHGKPRSPEPCPSASIGTFRCRSACSCAG